VRSRQVDLKMIFSSNRNNKYCVAFVSTTS
ncbi:MAG: hypothetical protein ACJA0Q_001659, partial [Saprospiraceae bacterium]